MKLAITPLVLSTATFGLMLGVAQNAQAIGLIPNVTATVTNVTSDVNWNIANTVNGLGLQGPPANVPSLTGNHLTSTVQNAWRSVAGQTSGTITFDLKRVYNLAGFTFWNMGGSQVISAQGIRNLTIQSSTNGTTWTNIVGAPTSLTRGANTTTSFIPSDVVSFAPVYASFVRFNVTSSYGIGTTARIGFSEIQFRAIPEPSSTLALLALGLAGIGLRKRI
ncbi:MAG: discoidin domain-containing protein [Microcystis novacekii Mn_MB_F_20050700_S1]|uniref:Discoidin domain-containing protein n=1 Tax=Microcystis novacekii Mn_MB_F_20050700_S1D TaxID=2486266 RepID=A0A552IDM8_9CHRO|nr:MAG: discoidin domain-containing protein [Microcystis novacekii Mn_MB_F_20050700_S1D]TRU86907.1 MAG: discoidin domain-containing protein [Microcystis novacekii Mn_MB_F_20050700_S1]